MKKVREALKRKREAGELGRMNPLEKSRANSKSWAAAIRAKCWQCQGEDADPNWQWRVGNCEIPDCGTYLRRPYQDMKGTKIPPSLRISTGRDTVEKEEPEKVVV